ncbi:MAG TPA: phosphatase domain-containing protein [Longimicrobiales bacterium]|nr:phosphatase domain-containing protein [Longimicrobiales bacterium]
MDWRRVVGRIAGAAEGRADRARLEAERQPGRQRAARVVPYRGYGRPDRVRIRGRVLYGPPPGSATPGDRWWVNLRNTYRRLETDEVAGARVRVSFRGTEAEVASDGEGHFVAELRPQHPLPGDRLWYDAHLALVDPVGNDAAATVAIPQHARFGVISDLDDTVLRTDVRNLIRMGREVLFGNVHTRVPFPGVGAFYRALHLATEEGRNPIFYVSSSPWNLYDLLAEFLRLHQIPAGPMELRDWRLSSAELRPTGHRDHKRKAIDTILETFPELPFILVGDSGQQDPEIYREIIHEQPGRVLAVYIRSVVAEPMRITQVRELAREIADAHADLGDAAPELVLVENTLLAARHAADRGWIDPAHLDDVGRQRAAEI